MSITAKRENKQDERMRALVEAAKTVYDEQMIPGMRRLKLVQSLGLENGFNKSDVERAGVDVLAGMLTEGKYEDTEDALKRLNLPTEVLRHAKLEALELCLASHNNTRAEYISGLLNPTSAELVGVQLGALRRIIQETENKSYYNYDIFFQALRLVNYVSEYKDQLSAAELKEYNQYTIKIYAESLRREITNPHYADFITQTLKERSDSWGIDPKDIALVKAELYTWAFDHTVDLSETAYNTLEGLGVPKSYVTSEGKKAVDRLLTYVRDSHNYLYVKELSAVISLSELGLEVMKEVGMKLHHRALELHATEADIEICTHFGLNDMAAEAVMNYYAELLKSDPLRALRFAKEYNMGPDKKHKAAVETYRWLECIEHDIIRPPEYFGRGELAYAMEELKGDFGPTKAEMKEIKSSILPKLHPEKAVELAKEIGDQKLLDEQMHRYYEELAESGTSSDISRALLGIKTYLSEDAYKKSLEKGIARGLDLLVGFNYRINEPEAPSQDVLKSLKDMLSEAKSAGIAGEVEEIGQKAFLNAVSGGRFTTAYWIAVAMDYSDELVKLSGTLKDIVGEMPPNGNLNLLRTTDSKKA